LYNIKAYVNIIAISKGLVHYITTVYKFGKALAQIILQRAPGRRNRFVAVFFLTRIKKEKDSGKGK
jgi:hypothetical protein